MKPPYSRSLPPLSARPSRLAALAAAAGALGAAPAAPPATQSAGPTPAVLPADHVGPVQCRPRPLPAFRPWFYEPGTQALVWGFHQFYEDPGNAVHALSADLLSVPGQTGSHPDVLLFNGPHFDPPEGIDAPPGVRRLLFGSIRHQSVQLLVNYSNAPKPDHEPGGPSHTYLDPTFFASTELASFPQQENPQTDPPVPATGISHFVDDTGTESVLLAPTKAALGRIRLGGVLRRALYVTGGIGYDANDLHPDDVALARQVQNDHLMVEMAPGVWEDRSTLVPLSVRRGNSFGVDFGDFDGDQFPDLYVGKPGNDYQGSPNALLLWNDAAQQFEVDTTLFANGPEPPATTVDVLAADVDGDGDDDLVVANRCRANGPCGAESEDYVLLNEPAGLVRTILNPGLATDSRSVAAGDLGPLLTGGGAYLELVFGEAGSDPYSHDLVLEDEATLQLFSWSGSAFVDLVPFGVVAEGPDLERGTQPHTRQVLLADLFGPSSDPDGLEPDGRLDLVVVNGREALKHEWVHPQTGEHEWMIPGNVQFFVNRNEGQLLPTERLFELRTKFERQVAWSRTVVVDDFSRDTAQTDGLPDLFHGRGNRFNGVLSDYSKNLGNAGGGTVPWAAIDPHLRYNALPGTEHAYGFDFADYDDDGYMDAFQAARGYNYFVRDLTRFQPTQGHYSGQHVDLADPVLSPSPTSNWRGRLISHGFEDGVFGDFDADGDLDVVVAGQRQASEGWDGPQTPDTIVLENVGDEGSSDGQVAFHLDVAPFQAGKIPRDAKIDLNGRDDQGSNLSDRAVAGDLDNDGLVDVVIRIGDVQSAGPTDPITRDAATTSFGWRYLLNVTDSTVPGEEDLWFRDVAWERMGDLEGEFLGVWNRLLASEVLADFDNNGALDLFSGAGRAAFVEGLIPDVAGNVSDLGQTRDVLFMNGLGLPVGELRDWAPLLLDPYVSDDIVADEYTHAEEPVKRASTGGWGTAQGDIDNDGDADLVVTTHRFGFLQNHPRLYANRLAEPVGQLVDEWSDRVGPLSGPIQIETAEVCLPGGGVEQQPMDDAMWPVLFDFDADGDLDLVYQTVLDVPRFLRNRGVDFDRNGYIDANDDHGDCRLGHFEDVTAEVIGEYLKPSVESQDMMAVDVDGDGDLDLVNNPFFDQVTIWRNDLDLNRDADRPVVTDVWPRPGRAILGPDNVVTLHGVRLDGVDRVQLRFANAVIDLGAAALEPVGSAGTRLRVHLPELAERGLAQIRVRRAVAGAVRWSTQYVGYFVQRGER